MQDSAQLYVNCAPPVAQSQTFRMVLSGGRYIKMLARLSTKQTIGVKPSLPIHIPLISFRAMATTQPSRTKVIIVGGGIAGPILAMFLKLKGYEPIVYERTPNLGDRGIGHG